MAELLEHLDTIRTCSSCWKAHDQERCPRCDGNQTRAQVTEAMRYVMRPEPTNERRRMVGCSNPDPELLEILRDVYRAHKRREARGNTTP